MTLGSMLCILHTSTSNELSLTSIPPILWNRSRNFVTYAASKWGIEWSGAGMACPRKKTRILSERAWKILQFDISVKIRDFLLGQVVPVPIILSGLNRSISLGSSIRSVGTICMTWTLPSKIKLHNCYWPNRYNNDCCILRLTRFRAKTDKHVG